MTQGKRKVRVDAAELSRRQSVQEQMKQQGVTVSAWSRANGFDPSIVQGVLHGYFVGEYGEAHRVCLALGLKTGASTRPEDFQPVVSQ